MSKESKTKADLTIIILTYNEEIHIERCINSIKEVAKYIYIVDSYSDDKTATIAESLGAYVFKREFKNQAEQLQWAIDQLPIKTNWIMRLDADEYAEPALSKEIASHLNSLPRNVSGIFIRRKVFFHGKWIKYGGYYPQFLLRIWRKNSGRVEQRWMDEHIVLTSGVHTTFKGHIIDDNKKSITWWIDKHNKYSTREMLDLMNLKYNFLHKDSALSNMKLNQPKIKRFIKEKFYSKMPLGFRATLYFTYRYLLRLGFLDGWEGFIFHFMQGWWYRMLVDAKCWEFERKLKKEYNGDIKLLLKELNIINTNRRP